MNKNNIHVGDWVYCTADPFPQYVKIKKEFTGLSYNADTKNYCMNTIDEASIDYYDVEPIPITPETLEMFGFEKGDLKLSEYLTLAGCYILPSVGSNCGLITIKDCSYRFLYRKDTTHVETDVNYIHEIQHCMEVANIEQELELKNEK